MAKLIAMYGIPSDREAFDRYYFATHAPLAKKTTVTIAIDHPEDLALHMPMISRLLYMVVIDILATGVAMRHAGTAHAPDARDKLLEDSDTSRNTRTDYARIISHSG